MTISGWATTWPSPAAAMVANQTTITGPKTRPMRWVPKRWIANSTSTIAIVSGITIECRLGAATFSPSAAERTEIAGVIIPSP